MNEQGIEEGDREGTSFTMVRALVRIGRCAALFCLLTIASYSGVQLWNGSWSLSRIAPEAVVSFLRWLGVCLFLAPLVYEAAQVHGWLSLLRGLLPVAVLVAVLVALWFLALQHGPSRVLGGLLIGSALVIAVLGVCFFVTRGATHSVKAKPVGPNNAEHPADGRLMNDGHRPIQDDNGESS